MIICRTPEFLTFIDTASALIDKLVEWLAKLVSTCIFLYFSRKMTVVFLRNAMLQDVHKSGSTQWDMLQGNALN